MSWKDHAKRHAKRAGGWAKQKAKNAPGAFFLVALLIALPLFWFDIERGFIRGDGMWSQWALIGWTFIAVMIYFDLNRSGGDPRTDAWHCAKLWFWSFLGPLVVWWITTSMVNFSWFPDSQVLTTFIEMAGGEYGPIVILYSLGFPRYLVSQAAKQDGVIGTVFGLVNVAIILAILIGALVPITGALATSELLDSTATQGLETASAWEASKRIVTSWGEVWAELRQDTQQAGQGLIDYATPTYHTGMVEQQQGRPLGVTVGDLQPIRSTFPVHVIDDDEGGVIDWTRSFNEISWFGTLSARTFADILEVELECIYRHDAEGYKNISVPSRPDIFYIQFTGEVLDERPFDCAFPRELFQDEFGSDPSVEALRGRFFVGMNYTFDTWGYATWTFMDNERYLSLRREGLDPAQALGISRTSVAKYTPGPMALGMERVQQPIPVDIQNPERNRHLAFSITLDPIGRTRGDVTRINTLTMQVPDPFILDTNACSGFPRDDDLASTQSHDILSEHDGYVDAEGNDRTVPEGYTWYQWHDLRFPEDQQYKTLRCPLVLDLRDDMEDWPWIDLLGPDVSPRQFTFVAQVNYDFYGESPVQARITLERAQ